MFPSSRNLRRTVIVYLIGVMLGGSLLFASRVFPSLNLEVFRFPFELMPVTPENPFLLSGVIFVKNVQVAFLASIVPLALAGVMGKLRGSKELGDYGSFRRKINRTAPLSCFAVSGLVAVENGGFLGFLLTGSTFFYGPGGAWVFAKLVLPHGVIEIPALLIACALGLSFSAEPVSLLRQGKNGRAKKKAVGVLENKGLWKGFLLVVALLGLAAVVESFLTPAIAY